MTHWIAISGSWRHVSPQVEKDVRVTVAEIMKRGDGIVTGGAPGVDFIAVDEALKYDPEAKRIKVILPVPLDIYRAHLHRWKQEEKIPALQVNAMLDQLAYLEKTRPENLTWCDATECNIETYYARNTKVIEAAQELVAFQVDESRGTGHTIILAQGKGLKISHYAYKTKPEG